ncbi:unnamed protein product [Diamesa tonsa]
MAVDIEALIDALPKKKPEKNYPYICEFCPKAFMNIKSRRYHERTKHPEEFKDLPSLIQYICDQCGNEFKKMWNLTNHKACVHNTERTFKCDEEGCDKMFKTKQARNEHKKIHTTTYKCTFEDCNKIFKSQQAYAQHVGMHNGNQFTCTFTGCDHLPFTRKRALQAHIRNKHKYMEDSFECPQCDKYYTDRSKLNAHMKYHSEKKIICDLCGQSFYEKQKLKRHFIKHSGLKAWMCHLCVKQKNFFFRDHLKKHLLNSHGVKTVNLDLNYSD